MRDLDRKTVTELARWAGAGIVISGSIYRAEERYRIDVQAYDTATGQVVTASRIEGTAVFEMADRLADDLRRGLSVPALTGEGIRGISTGSPEAYRLYTQGIQLHDELQLEQASTAFEGALESDPDFAVARFRLGQSLLLAGQRADALSSIDIAIEDPGRLPDRDRLLAEAILDAFRDRDNAGAEERLATLAALYPGDVESLFWKAQILAESGRRREAIRALRKTLDLDPNYGPAVVALAGHLEDLGLGPDAERIIQDFLVRNPAAPRAPTRETRVHPRSP